MSGERTGRSVRNRRISRKQKACRRVVHMQSPGAALARPLSGGSPSIRAGGQTAKSPRHRIGRRPPQGFRPSSRSNRHRKAHTRSRPAVRRKTSRRGSSRSRRSTSRPRECRRQRRPPRNPARANPHRRPTNRKYGPNPDPKLRRGAKTSIRMSAPSAGLRPRTVPGPARLPSVLSRRMPRRYAASASSPHRERAQSSGSATSRPSSREAHIRKRFREREAGGIKRGCPKRIRQPLSESGFRSFLRGPTSFLQPQIVTRERERTADQCAQEIEYLGRHPAP